MKQKKFQVFCISVLFIFTSNCLSIAGEALSWNLSRDMMKGNNTNPKGTWAFMDTETLHNASSYVLLPSYSTKCVTPGGDMNELSCWQDITNDYDLIGVLTKTADKWMVLLHPGKDRAAVILSWKSPISGRVDVLARISDFNSSCGDGIDWYLDKGSSTVKSGTINGNGQTFLAQKILVSQGQSLYFIIDKRNDNECDWTLLDVLITSQR